MTVAMLLENTYISAQRFLKGFFRKTEYLKLHIKNPVPSDIDIAVSQRPKLIKTVAEELGLLTPEYELYGHYKAKMSLDILDRLAHRNDGNYIVVTGYILF